ncbi:MAG: succinate dehydrogenase assembly factor 2 [Zetaproteobacteria bacterium]|nr:MAG: succinate dehydrogenase assembly factor 2 [Zetaproteobacteria bacterium]
MSGNAAGIDLTVRGLRYRLRSQGMLELDAWLAPLAAANLDDPRLRMAVADLLRRDPPELVAMMRGRAPIPSVLQPWLTCD